jgi:hypothetical protein
MLCGSGIFPFMPLTENIYLEECTGHLNANGKKKST